jgi:hypothetical protein
MLMLMRVIALVLMVKLTALETGCGAQPRDQHWATTDDTTISAHRVTNTNHKDVHITGPGVRSFVITGLHFISQRQGSVLLSPQDLYGMLHSVRPGQTMPLFSHRTAQA